MTGRRILSTWMVRNGELILQRVSFFKPESKRVRRQFMNDLHDYVIELEAEVDHLRSVNVVLTNRMA